MLVGLQKCPQNDVRCPVCFNPTRFNGLLKISSASGVTRAKVFRMVIHAFWQGGHRLQTNEEHTIGCASALVF